MKVLSFLTLLVILINLSSSIKIDCEYTTAIYVVFDKLYQCDVQNNLNITSPAKSQLTSVNGTILEGKTQNDVEEFRIVDKNVQFFPQGLDKIFASLKAITINKGRLKEIHKSDLNPFILLQELDFENNDIQVLEEGLFDLNPLLAFISFNQNQLKIIHPNVFDKLTALKNLFLAGNPCIDDFATENEEKLKEVIDEVQGKCNETVVVRATTSLESNAASGLKIIAGISFISTVLYCF